MAGDSVYDRVFHLKKLIYPRAEMKAILRAQSTPELVKMQLRRTIDLIDDILEAGVPVKTFRKVVQKQTAKEIRSKLMKYK